MRKIKYFIVAIVMMLFSASAFGCYVVKAQKMKDVKGTYKLTTYTYTPSYERKDGYTPKTYNYITDEEYLYEVYLVVTGSDRGYYVHKDVNTPAYSKGVSLKYLYDEDDSSMVEYVIWNDVLTNNKEDDGHKLGISKNRLNYSLPAYDFTQLITKKKMRSQDLRVNWKKVDDATDLSYVKAELGEIIEYDYDGYGVRGIYEWSYSTVIETNETSMNEYQYYFIVIDTAKGVTTAKISYALLATPTIRVDETVSLTHADDWSSLTIGDLTWLKDPVFSYYTCEVDGIKRQLNKTNNNTSDEQLEVLIASRMPPIAL